MNQENWVRTWLYVGLFMLFVQIIVGGITRLTGSGLSITKWEIVTGTIPPFTDSAWQVEFDKYKATPQYAKINKGMSMGEFKFIYFWEFIHRFWARAMGIVFLIPFIFFSYKGWMTRRLRKDLLVVVALAGLAAIFGWIMVASGLVNRPWVNAYKLSFHLLIGISVFSYLLWTTMKYVHQGKMLLLTSTNRSQRNWLTALLIVVIVQLLFGGWMSGMKAALFYPTWPLIGTEIIPKEIFYVSNWSLYNFIHYDEHSFVISLIHTLHRFTAYLLCALILWYGWRFRCFSTSGWYRVLLLLLCTQVLLGIVVLLTSIGNISVLWGVLHQGVGVLLLGALLCHTFFVRYGETNTGS